MAKRRFATKKEALAYPVLETLGGGHRAGYATKRAHIREMWRDYYGTYADLFYMGAKGVDEFLAAFPEHTEEFQEMAKQCKIAENAIKKYDDMRIKFVDELRDNHFVNKRTNFETLYYVMTDEQEAIYRDLRANPEKLKKLKDRKEELEAIIAKLPKDPDSEPIQKPYKKELNKILDTLKLFP